MAVKIERKTGNKSNKSQAGFSGRRAVPIEETKNYPKSTTKDLKAKDKESNGKITTVPETSKPAAIAVTSPYMDVKTVTPGEITVDQLIANDSLNLPVDQAVRRSTKLDKLNANLELKQKELKAIQNHIKVQIGEQQVAKTAFDYSTAVSQTADAKDRAEYTQEKTELNRKIRKNRIGILKGEEAITRHKANKARQYVDAFRDDVIDVDVV